MTAIRTPRQTAANAKTERISISAERAAKRMHLSRHRTCAVPFSQAPSGVAVELESFLVGQAAGADRAVAEAVAAERVNVVAAREVSRAVDAEAGDVEHEDRAGKGFEPVDVGAF